MSMALSALGKILLVSSACAVALSVCIGVRGCGWPSLMLGCTLLFVLLLQLGLRLRSNISITRNTE